MQQPRAHTEFLTSEGTEPEQEWGCGSTHILTPLVVAL